jgi:hypothetical protein
MDASKSERKNIRKDRMTDRQRHEPQTGMFWIRYVAPPR